ncbi:MAG: hypothetical protein ACJ780_11805 [Solirubrobacteraceae bacterium]
MGPVVVFLSIGRCGTQWLAATFAELYGGAVEVEHEPLGGRYRPRRFFRSYANAEAILELPEVAAHFERLARCDYYVETGWPVHAALPMLAARFPDRLRVVHLTRHPVTWALSQLSHNTWPGGPPHELNKLAVLRPTDPHVFQPHYAERWHELSAYEKCLFWWTEVHMSGLEFPARKPSIPFVRVQSEKLLAGERAELSKMLELMELDWDERWVARADELVDRWHHQTDRAFDPDLISRHRQTLDIARQLGYEPLEIDRAALDRRYKLAYGSAEARGPAVGAYNFGILLEQCGDPEGAEAAYRRADEHGLAAGAYNLGVLLEARGDMQGAMTAYRRAVRSPDPNPAARASEALERLSG